jgi:hypothetical protein
MLPERLGRMKDQAQGDLQKEQPHGQLHAADQRLREGPCGDIQQVEPPEADEDDPHQQGAGRDLVGAQPLRDRDRAEGLQGLHRNRQPIREGRGDVEEARGQQDGGRGEPVGDDQGDGDRDEHADIRNGTRELAAIELHAAD